MPRQETLIIGSRGSPLARAQAEATRDALIAAHPGLAAGAVGLRIIRTGGDRIIDRPLAEVGGKGLFTREIEQALLERSIDIAVHSMKDMPTVLPDGLVIGCVPAREDARDALIGPAISNAAGDFESGAPGLVLGTSSLRRRAQALYRWPGLRVVDFRGNVGTRLKKLKAGVADATLLAQAGINRLGLTAISAQPLALDSWLPAVGQGALAIEIRAGDRRMADMLAPLADAAATACTTAERAMLEVLDGSCRTPIAGHATIDGDGRLHLKGAVFMPDGSALWQAEGRGDADRASAIGAGVGGRLRAAAGEPYFAAIAGSEAATGPA